MPSPIQDMPSTDQGNNLYDFFFGFLEFLKAYTNQIKGSKMHHTSM